MIEMHGRFSPDVAAQIAVALEPYAPRWIEEPVPPENAAALARVRAATTISIATGERIHSIWDAPPFIEGGNVDIIQADLTHFGGFTGMRRLAGWTEAHYLRSRRTTSVARSRPRRTSISRRRRGTSTSSSTSTISPTRG